MSKKLKTLLAAVIAVICMVVSVTPAFAFVDPTWEESAGEETTAEEVVIEETPVEEGDPEPEAETQPETPAETEP